MIILKWDRWDMTYADLSLRLPWDTLNGIMHDHRTLGVTRQEDSRIWAERSRFLNLPNSDLPTRTSECGDSGNVGLVISTLEQKLSRCKLLKLAVQRWSDGSTDVTAFGGATGEEEDVGLAGFLGSYVVCGRAAAKKTTADDATS